MHKETPKLYFPPNHFDIGPIVKMEFALPMVVWDWTLYSSKYARWSPSDAAARNSLTFADSQKWYARTVFLCRR